MTSSQTPSARSERSRSQQHLPPITCPLLLLLSFSRLQRQQLFFHRTPFDTDSQTLPSVASLVLGRLDLGHVGLGSDRLLVMVPDLGALFAPRLEVPLPGDGGRVRVSVYRPARGARASMTDVVATNFKVAYRSQRLTRGRREESARWDRRRMRASPATH